MIVSDTFGRPWRQGLTDVAIGVSGIAAVVDLRDTPDATGRVLLVTEVAIADEIASAAELVMGKAAGVPVAIVRGLDASWFGEGSVRSSMRPPQKISSDDALSRVHRSSGARSARSGPSRSTARLLDALVEAACLAPAPHHSRPWRFVVIDTDDGEARARARHG